MTKYLVFLAQAHENFRLCELKALADLYNIDVDFSNYSIHSPFLIVDLKSDQEAKLLVQRTILCRSVYELYGIGKDIEELNAQVQQNHPDWSHYKHDSFRFDFQGYLGSRDRQSKVEVIEKFEYMGLKGPIKMKNAKHRFTVLDQYEPVDSHTRAAISKRIFFGRWICDSSRKIIEKYDLKRRRYIGTTSFDAELTLVSCNIAQATQGSLVYDPFVGTGSFLVAASHFGALTVGSDIDVRMLKGKSDKCSIDSNFKQYGTSHLYIDVMAVDFTNNSFRTDLKFDCIVCDPPYGVREGLKVLGSKNPEKIKGKEDVIIDGVLAHLRQNYIPPKKPYQFSSLLDDLLEFSSEHLRPQGRLCFWIPTANEDFEPTDIPHHADLKLIDECVQQFNKWSRRLLVYVRRPPGERGLHVSATEKNEFRAKYFKGFK